MEGTLFKPLCPSNKNKMASALSGDHAGELSRYFTPVVSSDPEGDRWATGRNVYIPLLSVTPELGVRELQVT